MKIILDTNVIISAMLSPSGLPARILNLVLSGAVTIVYDNNILAEYTDVINREKLKINKELAAMVIDFISKEGEFGIANPQKIKFFDEDDKKFYELYKTVDIDYLITGNIKHFPSERSIVTPKQFWSIIERR